MTSSQTAHPSENELLAFAVGKLHIVDVDQMEQHLSQCGTCLQAVEHVEEDTFAVLLRDAHTWTAEQPSTPTSCLQEPSQRKNPQSPTQAHTIEHPPNALSKTTAEGGTAEAWTETVLEDHPRYHVQQLIAVGGMGAVYQAQHRMMERTVALKVINKELVASTSAVERFRREVRAAAKLDHPNIVRAHDADQEGDVHFLVMEHVRGMDLHKVVKERGPLPITEACASARQVALGLQHAHAHGMVHRDIKPQNLMLTPEGQVKILDFGLASLTTESVVDETFHDGQPSVSQSQRSLTEAGVIMGTPDYLAPEQASDASSVDVRADIYSLGCTLYYLLTGQVPFPGGGPMDKILAHSNRESVPVDERRPEVPKDLCLVLKKMMAKDRNDRYQDPTEVAEALAPFTDEAVVARMKRQAKGQGRGRWPMIATVMSTAAILLVLLGIVSRRMHDEAVVPRTKRQAQGQGRGRWPTARGTVRMEINNPNIKVRFSDAQYHFLNDGETIKVKPGKHSLIVERGELKFPTRQFTVGQGEKVVLRVELLDGHVVVKQGDKELAKRKVPVDKKAKDDITLVRKLPFHDGKIEALDVSPDGELLLSADNHGNLCLWEIDSFQRRGRWKVNSYLQEAKFTKDGKRIVTLGTKGADLQIWDVKRGRQIKRIPQVQGASLAISPDDRYAFVGHGQATMIDLSTAKVHNTFDHGGPCVDAHFMADGKRVLSARGNAFGLLEAHSGKVIWEKKLNGWGERDMIELAVSADERYVAAGGRTDLVIANASDGSIIHELKGHRGTVNCLAFTSDGRHLITGSDDRTLRIWDLATGKEKMRTSTSSHCLNRGILLPDGKTFVGGGGGYFDRAARKYHSGSDHTLHVWRLPESVWPKKAPTRREPSQ